jgi:hypothetical protein
MVLNSNNKTGIEINDLVQVIEGSRLEIPLQKTYLIDSGSFIKTE